MKSILIIGLLVFPKIYQGVLFAQHLVINDEGLLHVQKVFDFPSKSEDDIYRQSKFWMNDTFENPQKVLSGDIEGKLIKGKVFADCGVTMGVIPVCVDLRYSFAIEIKNGRARMTINEFDVLTDNLGVISAETYCVKKKKRQMRTNSQAIGVIEGCEKISARIMETYSEIFEITIDDDW